MLNRNITLPLSDQETVNGILTEPVQENHKNNTGIVFAHGMSNDMHHPSLEGVVRGLAKLGYVTLRFNFPFKDRGKTSADPDHRLIKTWQAALSFMHDHSGYEIRTLAAAGKSLGARIASMAAAQGAITPDRLIFLGYPLHAPGKKDRLRDAHLPDISTPMLFFEGTRDPFCDLNILPGVMERLNAPAKLVVIEGGDHGFKLPASDPRTPDEVYALIVSACDRWLCQ